MFITPKKIGLVVGTAGLALLTYLSAYKVDTTEKVVLLQWGAKVSEADPGLHFMIPIVNTIERFQLTEQLETFGNTESDHPESMEAYSFDQQPADLMVSLNWKIDPSRLDQAFREYRTQRNLYLRLIQPRVDKVVKNVFGSYTASKAIKDRTKFNQDVLLAFQQELKDYPVIITGFQAQNIKFSPAYEKSVEDRMLAEVEVQKIQQNAEREKINAQIKVIQANATADAVRAEAKAAADATRMKGEAEAAAIAAKGNALGVNPGLIELTKAESWDGKLPVTMLPNTTIPFMDMNK